MSDPIPGIDSPTVAARAGRIARTTFLSLRNRNFRLYFIGQLISNSGNWLTNIALTLLILNITNSGLDVGLLAACQYGPMVTNATCFPASKRSPIASTNAGCCS